VHSNIPLDSKKDVNDKNVLSSTGPMCLPHQHAVKTWLNPELVSGSNFCSQTSFYASLGGNPYCSCTPLEQRAFSNVQWLLEQYDVRRKHCKSKTHDLKELYQFRKLVIFKDPYHQFLTNQERKKTQFLRILRTYTPE